VKARFQSCIIAAALAFAVSCGGRKEAAPEGPPPDAKRVDAATAGSVRGRVTFAGLVPSTAPITAMTDRACVGQNPGGIAAEDYVVADGGLENVFVYVKDGLGTYYFEVPTDPVTLDQRACRYVPHVVGVRAGQPLTISNSDDVAHNVHALPAVNPAFNKSQALKNMADTKVFRAREVMIPFKCDIHPWMQAYVGVIDHPYYAVTHDGGRFELKSLPPGTYTIEAWHEKLGTQTQQVTVAPKASKEVTFTFRNK
jgi:plastocyanin